MIDLPAINLLGAVLGTKEGRISGAILADYHASARDKLLHANLLEPRGDIRAVAALTDHDDEPVSVIWSDNGHGYFCPDTGWVEVGADRLGMFGVNMTTLIAKTLSRMEILSGAAPVELIVGHVWEVGNARIPGRTKPVSIWLARRIHHPVVWQQFVELAKKRPTSTLRLVLSVTQTELVPQATYGNHEIIFVRDVIDHDDGVAIDPELLAARLSSGQSSPLKPVSLSADGRCLTVRGKIYTFTGVKQRSVVRDLLAAWEAGTPERLTAAVLEQAECGRSVNTLAKLFKGNKDWRDIIREQGGMCWLAC